MILNVYSQTQTLLRPSNLFLQTLPNLPSGSPPNLQWVWFLIVILLGLGVALIVLLSKKREDVQLTDRKRAEGAESLIRTRDLELADCHKAKDKVVSDYEDLQSENRVLAGINIKELFLFWERKAQIEEKLTLAESENRRLSRIVEHYEQGGDPPSKRK